MTTMMMMMMMMTGGKITNERSRISADDVACDAQRLLSQQLALIAAHCVMG